MNIKIEITEKLLPSGGIVSADGAAGAVIEFAGVVRDEEAGGSIAALHYEAYEAMARAEMEKILRQLEADYPCKSVHIFHRVGRVPIGEAAIVVRIEAKHRAEAFGMLAEFMDRLKRDVPIWKKVSP